MSHEVGHSWGLDHQFNFISVMNYAPHKYRAYNVIYMDDCGGLRAAFPAATIGRNDLDVALFYSAGYQYYDDSNLSTQSVFPGGSITVSNFVIENPGTVTMTPEIDWYLVPTMNSWSGNYYIGTTTHSSLAPDNWFLTSRTLPIPASMPPGSYYLGAYVSNSSDDLGANNSSWLDRVITVNASAPPNDNWANTIIVNLPSFFVSGSNVGATTEAGEQNLGPAGATVWWSFYAAESGNVTIDTFGSNFDTMLHVYTGWPANLPDLTLVAQNDDTGGLQSQVMFDVVAGEWYEVRVAGYLSAQGQIYLSGTFSPNGFVPPTDYVVFRGLELEGSLAHFADSDDIRARYNPFFTLNSTEAPVWLIFDSVAPAALEFKVESNAGTPGLTRTIEFWAYDLNIWEVWDVHAESFNVDQVVTVPLNSFNIGAGGEVRSRVGWRKTGITLNFPWQVRVDHAGWNQ